MDIDILLALQRFHFLMLLKVCEGKQPRDGKPE